MIALRIDENSIDLKDLNETIVATNAMIARLRGHQAVHDTLLGEALSVLKTIEPECSSEAELLDDLKTRIANALSSHIIN